MAKNSVIINEETFKSMKASEQRLVLYNNIKGLGKMKFQLKIQWWWLGALTSGVIGAVVLFIQLIK